MVLIYSIELNKLISFLGVIPLGYAHEARHQSETTHHLPPPPNAMGESNLYRIGHNLVDFVEPDNVFFKADGATNRLVVFAIRDQIPMLETFLKQFHDEFAKVEKDIEIFHLEELFYALKKEAQQQGIKGEITVPNIHISNMLLQKDPHRHDNSLACKVTLAAKWPGTKRQTVHVDLFFGNCFSFTMTKMPGHTALCHRWLDGVSPLPRTFAMNWESLR